MTKGSGEDCGLLFDMSCLPGRPGIPAIDGGSVSGRPPEQCDGDHTSADFAPVERARRMTRSALVGGPLGRTPAGNVDSVTGVTAAAYDAWDCPHSRWSMHRGVSWQVAIVGKKRKASRRFSPQS